MLYLPTYTTVLRILGVLWSSGTAEAKFSARCLSHYVAAVAATEHTRPTNLVLPTFVVTVEDDKNHKVPLHPLL